MNVKAVCALVATVAVAFGVTPMAVATAAVPSPWKNCTQVNKKYPHGVGRAGARDKTSGVPVTTFRRSTRLYRIAMSYNKGLDRDKDGIACEKR
jgi:excalibur calcium-binding domain-containing protein